MAGILLALWVRQVGAQNLHALVNVDRETEPYHTVLLENRKLKTRHELFMAEA